MPYTQQNSSTHLAIYKNACKILHIQNKGAHLNTIEQFHIFKEASTNNHLKDDHTVPNSKIFQTILNDFLEVNY